MCTISVIVPTYNRSSTLSVAINSVLCQTYEDFELIIVDDGSTDKTEELVNAYIDPRIIYCHNTRKKGAPGARNTGLLKAKGDYVVFFDSDNYMHPDFLSKLHAEIVSKGIDVCSSFSNVIDHTTKKKVGEFNWVCNGDITRKILTWESYADNSSTMIRRQKVLDIGLLDEDCPAMQEWDTHIRLSKICTYSTVKECLIDYYVGGEDTISKNKRKEANGRMFIMKKFQREFKQASEAYLNCGRNTMRFISQVEDRKYRIRARWNLYMIAPALFKEHVYSWLYAKLESIKRIIS